MHKVSGRNLVVDRTVALVILLGRQINALNHAMVEFTLDGMLVVAILRSFFGGKIANF